MCRTQLYTEGRYQKSITQSSLFPRAGCFKKLDLAIWKNILRGNIVETCIHNQYGRTGAYLEKYCKRMLIKEVLFQYLLETMAKHSNYLMKKASSINPFANKEQVI